MVTISMNARNAALRGMRGKVINIGRQYEVQMDDTNEIKKHNPGDCVPDGVSEAEMVALAPRAARARAPRTAAKGPKPDIPDGARVQITDNSRSPALRGLMGSVLSFDGRQATIQVDGQDEPRRLNPNDLVIL